MNAFTTWRGGDYPRCRQADMAWGEFPKIDNTNGVQTRFNSAVFRQKELYDSVMQLMRNDNKSVAKFLTTSCKLHSNKTPLAMAEENFSGYENAMRLLKRVRGLSC